MRHFKIGDLSITASTREEAEAVHRELGDSRGNRIIFMYDDGDVQMISLKENSCLVFSQSGTGVARIGRLVAGSGQQIVKAAVDNIESTDRHGAKLRAKAKRVKRLAREDEYQSIIDEFEGKIPQRAKVLFEDIVSKICGNNQAYRVEMYQQIDDAIKLVPENWFNIVTWYRSNVLDQREVGMPRSLFVERKAFVTTVCRMGEQESSVGNIVEGAVENDEEFWARYADEGEA